MLNSERNEYMTVNEIEALTGLERSSISCYERKALITPTHLENGNRDYSEEDIKMLLRIKLLRGLHIPLSEIRALQRGRLELSKTLFKQVRRLELEKHDVLREQEVCGAMLDDGVTFAELYAEKYLDSLPKAPDMQSVFIRDEDYPKPFYPWRRYFARMLDLLLYDLFWQILLALVFNVNLTGRGFWAICLDSCVAIIFMLFLEPLWLHFLGTTPGKAIFGLRIENSDGSYLSYSEGLERTWGVIGSGLGYNIPILHLVRLWKSYNRCTEFESQPWEYDVFYTIRDTKWYRALFYIGVRIAFIFIFTVVLLSQRLPPNRGALTVAEFAENYNYYCKYYKVPFGNSYLDENGNWAEYDKGTANIYVIGNKEKPQFQFNVYKGYITEVSFAVKVENSKQPLSSYNLHLVMASLAFTGAQREVGIFSKFTTRIAKQIEANTFKDFKFDQSGIRFNCDFEYSGYDPYQAFYLTPSKNVPENLFSLDFKMIRLGRV